MDSKLDKVSVKNPSEAFVRPPESSKVPSTKAVVPAAPKPENSKEAAKEVTFGKGSPVKADNSVQFTEALENVKDVFNNDELNLLRKMSTKEREEFLTKAKKDAIDYQQDLRKRYAKYLLSSPSQRRNQKRISEDSGTAIATSTGCSPLARRLQSTTRSTRKGCGGIGEKSIRLSTTRRIRGPSV